MATSTLTRALARVPKPRARRTTSHPLVGLIVRRLAAIPVAVFGVATLSFFLVGAAPSDPARTVLGDFATPEAVAEFNHRAGLDQSLWQRYLDFLSGVVHGDLGTSYYTSEPITSQLARYLGPTLELVVFSLVVAVLLGTAMGTITAYARRSLAGRLARAWTVFAQSLPDFALGLVLIYIFFFLLGMAPAPIGQLGTARLTFEPITHAYVLDAVLRGRWDVLGATLSHLALPVIALGVVYSATFSRTTAALLNVALASPQVEFARAAGLRERTVVWYGLLSARSSILTYVAILAGFLVGGEAVMETVFAWDGLGQWALSGMLKLDLPVIQAFILVASTLTLLIYLALDIVVLVLDPRLR